MQYSLDFLKGKRGKIYNEKGYRLISWTKSFASFFLLIAFPWLAYSIADQEGHRTPASIFILILIAAYAIVEVISRLKGKKDKDTVRVFERRAEDWAIIVEASR